MAGRVRGTFLVRNPDGVRAVELPGREAWALAELVQAGESGCTPITRPAPRWSSYVHKLRRRGFDVQTIVEEHSGPYAGTHARYVLRSEVEIAFERVNDHRGAA